jgi:hypothetical protein
MAALNNAVNFNKLSKYNYNYISIDEVILLEYLIFNYQKNTLGRIVASRTERETGLKKARQTRAYEDLEIKGLIRVEPLENRNIYHLNLDKIIDSIKQLGKGENRSMQKFYYSLKVADTIDSKPAKLKKRKYRKNAPKVVAPQQTSLFD